jgi:acetyl-CoA carboxylase biotin carboxyl carrier protein
MIDLRYIKKLVDMIDESRVETIEISSDKGMKIRISKTAVARAAIPLAPPVALPAAAPLHAVGAPAASAAPAEAASKLLEVKSPMVGTFYSAPEPGAKPYVSVGSAVTRGQVLCIIEAMKIMNEIECEVTGTVREVCVTDAHPVEYGQVLFRVDPNG